MKKIICLFLALVMTFSFISCHVKNNNSKDELRFVENNGHGRKAILYKNELYSYTDERFSIYNKNQKEVVEIGKKVNLPFFPTHYYYVFNEEDPRYIFVENGEQSWYSLGVYARDELNFEKAVYIVEDTDIEISLDSAMIRYGAEDLSSDDQDHRSLNMYMKEEPEVVVTVDGPYRSGDLWYVRKADSCWRLSDGFVKTLKSKNVISD